MLKSIRGIVTATLLAGTALAATPAFADETAAPAPFTVTGTAAIVSQYRFRGISQSDNKPAVQASITLSHESGFYVSTWGSSTSGDFTNTPVAPGGTEIDVYGGYTKAFGAVKVDVGGYGYIYPSAPINNYYEIYGSLAGTVGPVTAKGGINYAPGQTYFNTFGVTNHNVYVYGELSGGIPGTPVSLHSHLGYTDGGLRYAKNYVDYSVGASVTWNHLTLDASVVGTNVSDSDSFGANSCITQVGLGTFASNSACSNYYHRPAKTVGVVSLTASF
jgi:uncharacterized protein (TIGR02001 family)